MWNKKRKFFQGITGGWVSEERTLGAGGKDKPRQKYLVRVEGKILLGEKRQDKHMVHVLRMPTAGTCSTGSESASV